MRRPGMAAAGFALADGTRIDLSSAVYIAPGVDRSGRLLLACVEPLEASPRGKELAAVALRAIRDTFAATPGPASDALLMAFASANAALLAQNRALATGRWQRRICVGATAVAIVGREIVVVQAAPTQAIFVQDRQLYTFPDIASWRGDYAPEPGLAEAHSLGSTEGMMPRLSVSEAAPGDLVVLASTSVGRALAHDDDSVRELFEGELLTHDLDGSVDKLERLVVGQDISYAFAVIVSLARLPRRSVLKNPLRGAGNRREPEPLVSPAASPPPMRRISVSSSADTWERRSGVRDWLIDTAELVSRPRQKTPEARARRLALAAPGAQNVQRFRESIGLSAELRAHLPRGPGLQVPTRLLAVSALLFVALGGTGVAMTRQKDRERQAVVALAETDAELLAAVENPGVAMTALTRAERSLASARQAGAGDADVVHREAELARLRDDVWQIRRLNDVTRIGALPAEASGGPAHLAIFDRTLYIASGGLYQLDPDLRLLVTLLSKGEPVDGGTVGELTHVSVDGGDVVAGDGPATYRRDAMGRWMRSALPVSDVGGLRADSPIITWGNATYALSWDGDIVRFDQSSEVPQADVWTAILDTPDLEKAKDLAVDGRIHVLLDDGRVLTFSRGVLSETSNAFISPVLNDPAFLAEAPFASAHYIVDQSGKVGENVGRIVRVGAGGDAWQYLVPAPTRDDPLSQTAAISLGSAVDLAIDELSGTVYWVSNGEIWRARLPAS